MMSVVTVQEVLSLGILLSVLRTGVTLRMLTLPKQYVRESGSSVDLECQFYADAFNLFDFPVVWHKKQQLLRQTSTPSSLPHWHPRPDQPYHSHQQRRAQKHNAQQLLLQSNQEQFRRPGVALSGFFDNDDHEDTVIDQINLEAPVSSDNEEDCQINMMGNLLEPFASAKRYRATFVMDAPRYIFGLSLSDVLPEDAANYTCQIDGPMNAVIGSVTHSVTVRAPVKEVIISGESWTTAKTGNAPDSYLDILPTSESSAVVTENAPSLIRCHVIGGGPTSDIRVHIGKRELTADMQLTRASTMTGNRCMRREQHVATKWSEQFEPTSSDDQASLNCSVAMAAGQLPVNSREVMLHVRYAPIITCNKMAADVDQADVELTCEIKARPEVTALYWMIDSSNGVVIQDSDQMGDYWTTNMVRSDSTLISKLHVRLARPESFRTYTILAENELAIESQDVELRRRVGGSTTADTHSSAHSYFRGDLKRMTNELYNTALASRPIHCCYLLISSSVYLFLHA